MKQIAMAYDSWFMDRRENWDCHSHVMIVGGDRRSVDLMPWGRPIDTENFRKKYPDAEFLPNVTVSMHRGRLDRSDTLRQNWPEHWTLIRDTWATFEDA